MSITKKIKSSLDNLDIPNYFITRAENKPPCIVYNYTEVPHFYSDNEEKAGKYTVLLNLYTNAKVESYKKALIEAMKNEGFVKKSVQSTLVDDTGFFNTPFVFAISIREEEK